MHDSPISVISKYINNHPLAVLSTIDETTHTPHGTTLYAGSDHQLNVFFITKTETTKHQNILVNPRVSLTFSSENRQTTLQISGTASEVSTAQDGSAAFQVLDSISHNSKDFRLPISKIEAGPYIVYKVSVEHGLLRGYEHTNRIDGNVEVEFRR